ncbi:MAG: hypothetical protein U0930_23570 [Pirellulales bacterium]
MNVECRLTANVSICIAAALLMGTRLEAKQSATPQDQANRAEQQRLSLYSASQSIPAPELVGRQTEKDLEALDLVEPLRSQMLELEKEFAEGIKSRNQPYRNLASTIEYVHERLDAFEKSLKNFASLELIEADAQHARKMIGMAIENKAPAYFQPTSDIANRNRMIDVRIKALEKINAKAEQLTKAKQIAQELKSQIVEAQKKLLDQLLNLNQPPVDNYTKPDREELIKLVRSTWEKALPGSKPIKLGLIGSDWQRSKKWEIQNRTLYEIDRSRLQAFVIVHRDDRTVECRRIQLNRDHTKQDQTTAWLLNDPKSEPEPFELLLKSKVQ